MSNSDDSCLGLIVLWIVVIFIGVIIFIYDTAWGIGFFVFIITISIAARQKKEPTRNNRVSGVANVTGREISRTYFTSVTQEVEKIISLYEDLSSNPVFLKIFEEGTNIGFILDGEKKGIKDQIKALFWIDMTRCFIDLGHELDLKSREGFGLFYFYARTLGLRSKFEYAHLSTLTDDIYQSITDFGKQIETAIKENPTVEGVFLLPKILADYDADQRQKYLVMLYRYASLTAKADGMVHEREAEWLSKILHLSQKPSVEGNVVISNEEEQQSANLSTQSKQYSMQETPKTVTLNSLIGLKSVKEEIETLANFIKIQQAREAKGLKTSSVSYHCVFTGNPGTGKTTVARIVANIYKSFGILAKGHLVETDRSGLVAEYVGQTAIKTNRIIDTALDGILFIDEAYSLISNSENDYGKEAVATLLKRMEDNRNRLVVILAGYSREMQNFIDSNPGLQSRFNRYIEFPDYSAEELYQIFELILRQFDYTIAKDAIAPLKEYLEKTAANKDKHFGNARFVRNLFEKTIERQANRLSTEVNLTREKLSEICSVDIPM
ncbi:MAG: AAA family ATPase [Tannerella sp.]|jgi:AAA+ superfamily predicted ATPase|nr:AAA family ATPase [Tannerella sp.]